MRPEARLIWGKSPKSAETWHPLILHMLDVAACADAILEREPESTRRRMSAVLGLEWQEARPWLLLVTACHDLGKACPRFQSKWPQLLPLTGLALPRSADGKVNHGFVGQCALRRMLETMGWPDELADLVSDAVGCHHGERASQAARDDAELEIRAANEHVRHDWEEVRDELIVALREVFRPGVAPAKPTLSGADFMLLAGLTSFADWIGSDENRFTSGRPEDCDDPRTWFAKRRTIADQALTAIGWEHRTPLSSGAQTFEGAFGLPPRPLQHAMADALAALDGPAVLLVEAPMGEGKTEAAFFAHLELQRRFGHRGLYVALPTKATGNAMFERTLEFLRKRGANRGLDLQLLHGAKTLNKDFQRLRISRIYDDRAGGEVRAAEWFTNKKRALLSEYGVGTVDQALVPILPVRHNFVRLWGLANRVVVLDEIHAYDAYTGTLLQHLVTWLQALGSSVVLLSATLSPSIRRRLADVTGSKMPVQEEAYPRLSVFRRGQQVEQWHFEGDAARRLTVQVRGISTELDAIRTVLEGQLAHGGTGLALVNTVQRAQDLYRLFPQGTPLRRNDVRIGKQLADGTKVLLFHARFPAEERQEREQHVLDTFGPKNGREGRCILIATQVAEQSLDLDFDVMVTDLAPIDLILQRAGRLWRHAHVSRPVAEPVLFIGGLDGDEPPSFEKPLWWGKVYREDLLLRTWSLLKTRRSLTLPDDIDPMVFAVYEEAVDVADSQRDRLAKAVNKADGEAIAHRNQANMSIIGFPNDRSWDDPSRFVLYDEDAPGVHRTLMAQTRLGEDSVVAIPILPKDNFQVDCVPDTDQAKRWFLRALSLSRPGVVRVLRKQGVPKGWEKSPLLRNCIPLMLDDAGCSVQDLRVRLDDELGLVYDPKEAE